MPWRSAVASAPSGWPPAPKIGSSRSVSAASRPSTTDVARYSNASSSGGRAGGGRRQHQVDAVGGKVLSDHRSPGAQPQHVRGRHAAQLAEVGGEARFVPVPEPADGRPHRLEGLLEGVPHVHLALVAARRLADVAAADPQRGHAAGIAVQPAGGQEAGGQRQLHDGGDGRVAQLGVDLGQRSRAGRTGCAACRGRAARRPGRRGRRAPGTGRAAPGRRGSGGRPAAAATGTDSGRTVEAKRGRSAIEVGGSTARGAGGGPPASPMVRASSSSSIVRPAHRRRRWRRRPGRLVGHRLASDLLGAPAAALDAELGQVDRRRPAPTRSSGPPRFRSQAGQR